MKRRPSAGRTRQGRSIDKGAFGKAERSGEISALLTKSASLTKSTLAQAPLSTSVDRHFPSLSDRLPELLQLLALIGAQQATAARELVVLQV
jgi:hypothetical protein